MNRGEIDGEFCEQEKCETGAILAGNGTMPTVAEDAAGDGQILVRAWDIGSGPARARVQLRQLTDERLLERVATDRPFLSGKPPPWDELAGHRKPGR